MVLPGGIWTRFVGGKFVRWIYENDEEDQSRSANYSQIVYVTNGRRGMIKEKEKSSLLKSLL